MTYNEEFIKGVTYGDVEDLMYSAQDEGFLTFLENFRDLADLHAQAMLEGFINDHFPENSKENEYDDLKKAVSEYRSNYEEAENIYLQTRPSKLAKLIKNIRKQRDE